MKEARKQNLAFIGARGAGKSKISRRLSKITTRPVFSTDILVAYEAGGLSIPEIVSRWGWPHFRDLEHEILTRVAEMQNVIVDCGGGILVEAASSGGVETFSERKASVLRTKATVVYVRRNLEWLETKVSGDASRPSLSESEQYREILLRRLPWYEKSADFVLDMNTLEPDDAAELIKTTFY